MTSEEKTYKEALEYATAKHEGQKRKASPTWPSPRKGGVKETKLKEKSLGPHHSPQGALNQLRPTL